MVPSLAGQIDMHDHNFVMLHICEPTTIVHASRMPAALFLAAGIKHACEHLRV